MAAKPVERGPQTGAPPSLEQIPVDRLEVDPAYQRATDGHLSRRIITGMVREWKWSLCQVLVVSRREGGGLYVLDGQHRLAGARARGDIPFLPCVVLSSLDLSGEAGAFVELNTRRQKLSQTDIFNGQLAAGDEVSKITAALLEETGWRVVRSSATDGWKPGDLVCAPMLARQISINGQGPVRLALTALRRAYPDTVVTSPSRLLEALIVLFRASGAFHGRPIEAIAATIAARRPDQWMAASAAQRTRRPGLSVVSSLVEVLSGGIPPRRPPPPAPRVAAPAPRPAADEPLKGTFGLSGKGWCDQCEQLVTRDQASACKSTFCAMKDAKAA